MRWLVKINTKDVRVKIIPSEDSYLLYIIDEVILDVRIDPDKAGKAAQQERGINQELTYVHDFSIILGTIKPLNSEKAK